MTLMTNQTAIVKEQIDLSTEEKIVEAARKVFTKKGLAGARMQDIADEAGINKALLHYYFRSKEKLFEKIFEEASTKMFEMMNKVIDDINLNIFQKIEAFVEGHISTEIANPYIPAFLMNEAHQNPAFVEKFLKPKMILPQKLVMQIQEAINLGQIKPMNPVQLFLSMMSLSAFPFVAKPLFQIGFNIPEEHFSALMEQRKKHVIEFIMAAIKP
jgi:AcrR family transcriptional regulator